MGTYDTRGGHPLSPPDCEPWISPEEEQVLDLLESAGVASEVNDLVVEIVHGLALRCAKAEAELSWLDIDAAGAIDG